MTFGKSIYFHQPQEFALQSPRHILYISILWRDVRVVEGARLESVCTLIAYRGFESLSLRHTFFISLRTDLIAGSRATEGH
jgi:hypothetical protein